MRDRRYLGCLASLQTVTISACPRQVRDVSSSFWRSLLDLCLRKGETFEYLAAGFGISKSTAWRYVNETVELLAARAPKFRQAVRGAKRAGHAYVILDGTLIPIDRVARDRPFYSGKHKKHGMNLQVIAFPDGDILWVSGALPGSVHDKKAEWIWGVLDELEKAGLVTPTDKGYQGESPLQGQGQARTAEGANRAHAKLRSPSNGQTRSSRHGTSLTSCAAAHRAAGNSPRQSMHCSYARPNQVGKGSLVLPIISPLTGTAIPPPDAVMISGADRYSAGERIWSDSVDITPVGERVVVTGRDNAFDADTARVTVQSSSHECTIDITVFKYGRETFAATAHIKRDIKTRCCGDRCRICRRCSGERHQE